MVKIGIPMNSIRYLFFFALLAVSGMPVACSQQHGGTSVPGVAVSEPLTMGAERMDALLPLLRNKSVGLVVNHTSLVGNTHLVDTLVRVNADIRAIFAPEHGFRGEADAGEHVSDGRDAATGLPVISLYGANKKPTAAQLEGIDVVLFDIQDVGARFYTYISTMHYVMETAAEQGLPVIILDRPNPNGHYVDGPVLDPAFSSFVGMHPVPVVHGMTVGEYALMINGEGWLDNGLTCELTVIPCTGYDHKTFYELPVPPSPNLPNMRSIYLYPALCLFEGTVLSVGRGTGKQFQVLGAPGLMPDDSTAFRFTPQPMPGAKSPKHQGMPCTGIDFTFISPEEARHLRLAPAIYADMLNRYRGEASFFTPFFDKLAGSDKLRMTLESGASEEELERVYREGLGDFLKMRKKYLLYPDFDE